tara:strand:+ start:225 stop:707 length:483 start_codon:yes stop_codon:yes gene_type:complete
MRRTLDGNLGQMSFRVVDDDAYEELEDLAANTSKSINRALSNMGRQLKTKIFSSIKNTPKTGNVYYRDGERRRRSSPYNSHADESTALRKSLSYKVRGHKGLTIGYGINRWYGDADEYAMRIELGGTDKRGRTIEPRPSIFDNLDDVDFGNFLNSEMKKL